MQPLLRQAIELIGNTTPSNNYWDATRGNAGYSSSILLAWAELCERWNSCPYGLELDRDHNAATNILDWEATNVVVMLRKSPSVSWGYFTKGVSNDPTLNDS